MKKGLKRVLSVALSTVMVASSISFAGLSTVFAADAVTVYSCEGVQEAAYVEWAAVSGTDHYYVSYSKNGTNFTQIDDELIRQYPDRWRADLVGLAAGDYKVKVEAKKSNGSIVAETTVDCKVIAQDRTGFTFSPKSLAYDNGGCGAYNADGTLKSNANVLYVTDDNFDKVTLNLTNKDGDSYTATGLADITQTMGNAAAKGKTNPPLAVRFLGTIGDSHSGLVSPQILETKGGDSSKVNITFEGIGEDTIFNGLGLRLNGVANCEVRNISFWNWHDDAIQLQGNENSNHWIHNNDLFYGEDHGGDQKKGDGATDVKDDSRYITYSYNHYWDSGKTSLCGMKGETGDNYISYHHNWFDHSDSRHPRIRTMFVHVYNNYYDGNSKYGVGAANSSSAFVEGNYFRNCKHPMLSSLQGSDIMENSKTGEPDFSAGGTFSGEPGGIIKAYNNYVEGSDADKFNGGVEPVYYDANDTKTNGKATQFDAYLAKSRSEAVPSSVKALSGGKTFNNANVDDYILSIPVEEPAAARDKAVKYAGRTGNDFIFTFNNSVDDKDSEINTALASAVQSYANNKSDDFISMGGAADGSGPVDTTTTTTTTTEATTETTTKNVEGSTETTTTAPVEGYKTIDSDVLYNKAAFSNNQYFKPSDSTNVYAHSTRDAVRLKRAGEITFTLAKGATVKINASGANDTDASRKLTLSGPSGYSKAITLNTAVAGPKEDVYGTNLAAGTYTLNASNDADIYSITVTFTSAPETLKGDANGDGTVDKADVTMVLDYASGKISAVTNAKEADVSGNGTVTAYDAYLIGKIVLGLNK